MARITQAQIENVVQAALEAGRFLIPKNKRKVSTAGNLRFNATMYENEGGGHLVIYVSGDGENGIAPYAPFTNEPWISPHFNGKPNPNEGWWDRFVEFVVNYIQTALGGEVKYSIGEE